MTGTRINAEPVVFATALEGLLERGVGSRLGARAKERLLAIGIDLSRPFLPAYTAEQWVGAIRIAAESVFPHLSKEEAEFQLGREFVAGLKHTLVGKALWAYGFAVGPRRMLKRMSSNFRSTNNYTEAELIDGPEGLVMETRIAEELLPQFRGRPSTSAEYMRGVLYGILELAGLKDVHVERLAEDPELRLTRYRLSFRE